MTSRDTRESEDVAVALVHFGGHDFRCAAIASGGDHAYDAIRLDLVSRYETGSLADVVTAMNRHFGESAAFGLRDAFVEERRRILGRVVADTLDDLEARFVEFYRGHGRLLGYLADSGVPLPDALRLVTEFALFSEVRRLIGAFPVLPPEGAPSPVDEFADDVRRLLAQAAAWGVRLPAERLRPTLTAALLARIEAMHARIDEPVVSAIHLVLDLVDDFGLPIDLWKIQNAAFRLLTEPGWRLRVSAPDEAARTALERRVLALADRLHFALDRVSLA